MSMNPDGNETHVVVQTLDDIVALFPELTLTTFVIEDDVIRALPGLIRTAALLDAVFGPILAEHPEWDDSLVDDTAPLEWHEYRHEPGACDCGI